MGIGTSQRLEKPEKEEEDLVKAFLSLLLLCCKPNYSTYNCKSHFVPLLICPRFAVIVTNLSAPQLKMTITAYFMSLCRQMAKAITHLIFGSWAQSRCGNHVYLQITSRRNKKNNPVQNHSCNKLPSFPIGSCKHE